MSRIKKKDDWLRKTAGIGVEEFLGQRIDELNKEAKHMDLLQKDVAEEKEVQPENTDATQNETKEQVQEEVKTDKTETKIEFVTKEEAVNTFTELLTPILVENEKLNKELTLLKEQIVALQASVANVQKETKEQVDTNVPVASLTAIVKERLLQQLNSEVNPFRNPITETNEKDLLKQKPAVKVESEQPKHAMAGLLENV